MANGLFTPQGYMSPDEVLGLTGFDQQGFAAPTVEEIRRQLQTTSGQGGAFLQQGNVPQVARRIGAGDTRTGMGGRGIAGAIRDMKARSTLADFAKEGGDLNSVEGALKASQLLAERGLISQAQAYADNAAAMQAANQKSIGEKFGDMTVLGRYGDSVLLGQVNKRTGKVENRQVIDTEEYENRRAAAAARKKGAGEGSVPSKPSKGEMSSAATLTEGYEYNGMEIDRTVGGLSSDGMEELNRRIADAAKTLQSQVKEAGDVLSYNDALNRVAPAVIDDNVIFEEGDFYNSVSLKTLEEEEELEDELGLF